MSLKSIDLRKKRIKRNYSIFHTLAIIAWGMILWSGGASFAYASQPPDPTEQLRPYADKVVAILTDPELQGAEHKKERYERLLKAAEELLDFPEMSKRVLGRTWRDLTPAEQQKFTALFAKLLEHAYLGRVDEYSNQKVIFKDQRIKGERAQVITDFVDADKVFSVSYIMMLKGDKWMVYDVVVEGVSLVRNYMEQFNDIIRKEGYASLVKQVEEKIAELEQNNRNR